MAKVIDIGTNYLPFKCNNNSIPNITSNRSLKSIIKKSLLVGEFGLMILKPSSNSVNHYNYVQFSGCIGVQLPTRREKEEGK